MTDNNEWSEFNEHLTPEEEYILNTKFTRYEVNKTYKDKGRFRSRYIKFSLWEILERIANSDGDVVENEYIITLLAYAIYSLAEKEVKKYRGMDVNMNYILESYRNKMSEIVYKLICSGRLIFFEEDQELVFEIIEGLRENIEI